MGVGSGVGAGGGVGVGAGDGVGDGVGDGDGAGVVPVPEPEGDPLPEPPLQAVNRQASTTRRTRWTMGASLRFRGRSIALVRVLSTPENAGLALLVGRGLTSTHYGTSVASRQGYALLCELMRDPGCG